MSEGVRYARASAIEVARELSAALVPACVAHRCKVVGSLRRGKREVGDVELLVVGRREMQPDPQDLLGNPVLTDLAEVEVGRLLERGVIAKRVNKEGRTSWGVEIKLARHVASGIPVDLFTATEENWWSLLVCRTGSAASNMAVCMAAIARGWKWRPNTAGFWRARRVGEQGEGEMVLVRPCRSEADVFGAVGLRVLPPHLREQRYL